MPGALILGVPAGNKTVVRYAWETDPGGMWEYLPKSSEWGVPLAWRVPLSRRRIWAQTAGSVTSVFSRVIYRAANRQA
jgi:hypothetical protein